MKKKNIHLEKKLFLNKEVLAELNSRQQDQVIGGVAPSRRLPCVTEPSGGSCNTIPPMGYACIYC